MKNKQSPSQSVLTGLLVALVLAASNSIVRAQQCTTATWNGPTATPGNWFTETNWVNSCLLDKFKDTFINNGGIAQILAGIGRAQSVTLGANQGDSGVLQVDGPFQVLEVYLRCEDDVKGDIYVGKAGTGTLIITNGANVFSGHGYIASVANPTRPISNGVVRMYGQVPFGPGPSWVLDGDLCSGGAGLFIGCSPESDVGGTAQVHLGTAARIQVNNSLSFVNAPAVKVGVSGTVTGGGSLELTGPTDWSKTMSVHGTLSPSGQLTIKGNLDLRPSAVTVCNATQQNSDIVAVQADQVTGGGFATLGGRLTVIMTGTFSPGTSITLVHAENGFGITTFQSESITYNDPSSPCMTPVITYGPNDVCSANRVCLYLQPCD